MKSKGNTKLPFGLCEKYGIILKPEATPRDAWDALKKWEGLTPAKVYKALEQIKAKRNATANKIAVKKQAKPLVMKKVNTSLISKENLTKAKKLLKILEELIKWGIIL